MNFYKLTLKAGHQGVGRYAEIVVGVYANSCMDAINNGKMLPMVKHNNCTKVLKIELINEQQYIFLLLQDPYNKVRNNKVSVTSLDNIAKKKKLFDLNLLKSEEGIELQNFYYEYIRLSNKREQAILQNEYYNWACDVIQKYENNYVASNL